MDIVLLMLFILAFLVAYGIGARDETMSLIAGSGILGVGASVFVGAIIDFLGTLYASREVEKTLGSELLYGIEGVYEVFAILAAMCIWLLIASFKGLPISTTHSAVGAVIGVELALLGYVNTEALIKVLEGMVFSPVLGLILSYLFFKAFKKLFFEKKRGIIYDIRLSATSSYLLFILTLIAAFYRSGNDAANATAFLIKVTPNALYSRIIVALGISLGLLTLGKRIVRNVGSQLVVLDPPSALSIQISTSITLGLCTILGLPISGTHVLIMSFLGMTLARRTWVNLRSLRDITLAWVITLPLSALLSACITHLLLVLKLL